MRFCHRQGITCRGLRRQGCKRYSTRRADEEVINLAVRESRALLTEDKDFGQLVYASAAESPGVMLIRFPANTRKNIATIVVEFIERNTEKIKGHFIVVQPGRIRISE